MFHSQGLAENPTQSTTGGKRLPDGGKVLPLQHRKRNMQGSLMKIGAVLLAAGEGSRMGGVPKCLLTLDGVPLISRYLAALRETGIDKVVVVTGYYGEQIEAVIADTGVVIARNPYPEAGQQSSVRVGIETLGPQFDLVMVSLADQPLVGSDELAELVSAFNARAGGTQIVYPSVRGERGNPVLFSGELIRQMLSSAEPFSPRKFMDAHPALVQVHETDNEHFVLDLDTRNDIEAFEQRTGRRLLLPAG
jgi:CTP:molybdopterin cytidylyltransferase MocA